MKRYVIIVAGGKGLRMGGDLPKQFIPMAGKPVLMHTVEKFWMWDNQINIILVLPIDHQAYWKMLCKEIGWGRNPISFRTERTECDSGRNRSFRRKSLDRCTRRCPSICISGSNLYLFHPSRRNGCRRSCPAND